MIVSCTLVHCATCKNRARRAEINQGSLFDSCTASKFYRVARWFVIRTLKRGNRIILESRNLLVMCWVIKGSLSQQWHQRPNPCNLQKELASRWPCTSLYLVARETSQRHGGGPPFATTKATYFEITRGRAKKASLKNSMLRLGFLPAVFSVHFGTWTLSCTASTQHQPKPLAKLAWAACTQIRQPPRLHVTHRPHGLILIHASHQDDT